MSFNKSLLVTLGATVGMLMAQGVYADYSENFEAYSASQGAAMSIVGWGGYGTYTNTETRALAAGVPIAGEHTTHLAVDGWVTNTITGATTGDAQLDMLVKVALPEEELSVLSDDEAKFAMAINTNGVLYRWAGESAGWVSLETPAYTEGQWIRVAVVYDNGSQLCKVSIDGNACKTDSGYTTTNRTEMGGAWYPVIQQATKIASLKVVGTTALDDIKVTHVANNSYTPTYTNNDGTAVMVNTSTNAAGQTVALPMDWYAKYDVPTSAQEATDGSGMTLEAKYVTGMDPNGGEKFEMQSMTMNNDGGTVKANIALPVCNPPTGAVKIQTADNKEFTSPTTSSSLNGQGSAEIPLSSGNVTYFRMVLDR